MKRLITGDGGFPGDRAARALFDATRPSVDADGRTPHLVVSSPVAVFGPEPARSRRAHRRHRREPAGRCLKRGDGRIVNIASVAGKEGIPNASHHSASKAGLIAPTKSLAKEPATKGVLANVVSPAAAKTAIRARRARRI